MGRKRKTGLDPSNLASQWGAEVRGEQIVLKHIPTLAEAMALILAGTVEIMKGELVQWRGLVADVKPPPDLWS